MQPGDDEETWRSIIDNFGDRVELDDDPSPVPLAPVPPRPPDDETDRDPDRFIAPDPPLPPRPTRDRMLAWAGVIGTPILVLVLLLLGVHLGGLLAYTLVGAFVGGFLYLVVQLPRTNDDPFDDGARL